MTQLDVNPSTLSLPRSRQSVHHTNLLIIGLDAAGTSILSSIILSSFSFVVTDCLLQFLTSFSIAMIPNDKRETMKTATSSVLLAMMCTSALHDQPVLELQQMACTWRNLMILFRIQSLPKRTHANRHHCLPVKPDENLETVHSAPHEHRPTDPGFMQQINTSSSK